MSDMPFFSYKILIPPFSERIFKWSIQIRIFTFQDRKWQNDAANNWYLIFIDVKMQVIICLVWKCQTHPLTFQSNENAK